MGVRFRHQGRNPASGLDCIGTLLTAAARAGALPPNIERTDYGRAPSAELEARLAHYCDQIEAVEAGAILAIRWPGDARAGHVAICAGDTMIHCYSHAGKVVEHGYRAQWPRWTKSIWWLRSLARG